MSLEMDREYGQEEVHPSLKDMWCDCMECKWLPDCPGTCEGMQRELKQPKPCPWAHVSVRR